MFNRKTGAFLPHAIFRRNRYCLPRSSSSQFREILESEEELLAHANSDDFGRALLRWSIEYGDLLLFEAAVGCVLSSESGSRVELTASPGDNGKPKSGKDAGVATQKVKREEVHTCCQKRRHLELGPWGRNDTFRETQHLGLFPTTEGEILLNSKLRGRKVAGT